MDGLDRRVRRTRRAVQDALVDAIVDKGYDAVTVTDLIERADIGRSTFYSHFTGKQDVLFHTIDELVDRLGSARPTAPEEMFAFSLPLLEHVDEQQHLVRALLGPRGGAAVHARIRHVLSSIIRAELLTALPPDTRAPADLDLAVTCAAGAFTALLTRWMEDGTAETPARMDAVFRAVLTKGVAAALEGARAVEQQLSTRADPRSGQTAAKCALVNDQDLFGDCRHLRRPVTPIWTPRFGRGTPTGSGAAHVVVRSAPARARHRRAAHRRPADRRGRSRPSRSWPPTPPTPPG